MTTETRNTARRLFAEAGGAGPHQSPEIPAEIQSHIADLTPDMIPIVERIESGPASGMTQHNYGGYMSALATLCPGNDPRMLFILCNAMIAAGGNEAGIKSACAINTGRDPLQAIGL